jgi:tetratricopeptide (TPR) repeat protein
MTDSIPSISTIKKLKFREFLPDRNSTLVPKKDFRAAYANTLWHKDVFPAGHYIGKLKRVSQQNVNLYQFHLPLKGLDQFIKKIESLTFDRLDGSVSWHFKRWVRILNQDGIEGLTNEYHRMLEDKHTDMSVHSLRFNNLANKAVIPKDFSWDKVNKEIVEAQQWAHDNHLEEARKKLSGILEIVPFHCFVLLELGRIAWAAKDAISAEKYFNQALQVNPFNIDAMKALGLLLLATNQTAGAIAQFEKGLQIDNMDPELWQWLGKSFMESNDFDKARLAYERSINYATA